MSFTVSCAESCTGGNIAHKITLVPGSSSYFLGGVVSYSNEVKAKVLSVPEEYIDKYGAVSRPVVEAMANGVRRLTCSEYAVATSGIAGPSGGTADKPVGSVWIAACNAERTVSRLFHFDGGRYEIIESATNAAFALLEENFGVVVPVGDRGFHDSERIG